MKPVLALACLALVVSCGPRPTFSEPPAFTPPLESEEFGAMLTPDMQALPLVTASSEPDTMASLWTGGRGSLLGDRRAMARGDILTVVIEIDDSAAISNSSDRSRQSEQEMGIGSFFGLPETINGTLPQGASLSPAVSLDSNSRFSGEGSVSRNEQLELRVAATVVEILPNGVLAIEGTQEVRVNYELRQLTVTGYVRPADISRQNEVTYDKIAQARISYGGEGLISDVQAPRYGQQALEYALPF